MFIWGAGVNKDRGLKPYRLVWGAILTASQNPQPLSACSSSSQPFRGPEEVGAEVEGRSHWGPKAEALPNLGTTDSEALVTLPPSANGGVVVGEKVSVVKEEGNEKRERGRGVGGARKGWENRRGRGRKGWEVPRR